MVCNFIDFSCNSHYDGLYALETVYHSELQIYHSVGNNNVFYYGSSQWFVNDPLDFRWYTNTEEIFGVNTSVVWYETDDYIVLNEHENCIGKLTNRDEIDISNFKTKKSQNHSPPQKKTVKRNRWVYMAWILFVFRQPNAFVKMICE